MTIDLDQVVLDGGRQFVNFFEGRILTGRDLRDEQSAARQGRNALGRGIGAGVVHGFEVTDATPVDGAVVPTVRIAAGLAINREGQSLDLKAARTLRLAVLDPDSPDRNRGVFDLCADQPSTSDAPTAEGFHILTVAPATAYQEEAPKSGIGMVGLLVLGLACATTSFASVYFLAPAPTVAAAATTTDAEAEYETAEKDPADKKPYTYTEVQEILITIGTAPATRYLIMILSLSREKGDAKLVTSNETALIDAFLLYLRSVSVKDFEDPAFYKHMREQLGRRADLVLGDGVAKSVLITEFLLR